MAQIVPTMSQFRVGSVLGKSFSILFGNIVSFMALTVIIFLPLFPFVILFAWLFDSLSAGSVDAASIIVLGVVIGLTVMFLYLVLTATLTYATFQDLRGRRATIGKCLSNGWSRALPVLGVAVLALIAILVGSILLVIPGLIVLTMLWVVIPVAVVERPGVMASLRRSSELTKGNRWRIIGIYFLMTLLSSLLSVVISLVSLGVPALEAVLGLAQFALLCAFNSVVMAVAYHDLRVAKEGVSVEEIAAVFD